MGKSYRSISLIAVKSFLTLLRRSSRFLRFQVQVPRFLYFPLSYAYQHSSFAMFGHLGGNLTHLISVLHFFRQSKHLYICVIDLIIIT